MTTGVPDTYPLYKALSGVWIHPIKRAAILLILQTEENDGGLGGMNTQAARDLVRFIDEIGAKTSRRKVPLLYERALDPTFVEEIRDGLAAAMIDDELAGIILEIATTPTHTLGAMQAGGEALADRLDDERRELQANRLQSLTLTNSAKSAKEARK